MKLFAGGSVVPHLFIMEHKHQNLICLKCIFGWRQPRGKEQFRWKRFLNVESVKEMRAFAWSRLRSVNQTCCADVTSLKLCFLGLFLLRNEPGNHRSDEDGVIAHRRLAPPAPPPCFNWAPLERKRAQELHKSFTWCSSTWRGDVTN